MEAALYQIFDDTFSLFHVYMFLSVLSHLHTLDRYLKQTNDAHVRIAAFAKSSGSIQK